MDYMEIGAFGLEVDSRVLEILLNRTIKFCRSVSTIHPNQIEDVEYVELEPDPNDGSAPMATLVYNPQK